MTPLHQLLLEAIAIAKQREPGLSDSLIAYRAGITQPTLSRAKRRCGPSTLEAVLDALGLELALIARPAPKRRSARAIARNARAGAPARGKKIPKMQKQIQSKKPARRSGPKAFVAHSTSHTYARGSIRRPARSRAQTQRSGR
ncbi:MAG TPA: hypothetical protein VK459_17805 [Polyangiaceae bacterium]|nr:hypothetical protein [Polyangiaceae bacterium]